MNVHTDPPVVLHPRPTVVRRCLELLRQGTPVVRLLRHFVHIVARERIGCARRSSRSSCLRAMRSNGGGEYEGARDARAALAKSLPYVLALMVFIVVCLFNSIRTTVLIWLIMPLVVIGVTTGLLVTGMPFGFMALLGVLSVGGELIKTQIVVLSKVLTESAKGKTPYQAILEGGTSKMRPVCMVVLTTVLGMIPLLVDPFFGAMAVCIMFGLTCAAVLALIVTPVLYAIFFGVHEPIATTSRAQPIQQPVAVKGT